MGPTGHIFELILNKEWRQPSSRPPKLYRKVFKWWVKVPFWAWCLVSIKTKVLNKPIQTSDGIWCYDIEMIDERYKWI